MAENSEAASVEQSVNQYLRKRKRLSRACNNCRSRKIRCDEQLPSCSNCRIRRLECVTTDPKTGEVVQPTDRQRPSIASQSFPNAGGDVTEHSYTFSRDSSRGVNTSNRRSPTENYSILPTARGTKEASTSSVSVLRPEENAFGQMAAKRSKASNAPKRRTSKISSSTNVSFEPIQYRSPLEVTTQDDNVDNDETTTADRSVLSSTNLHMAVNMDENSFRRKYLGPSSLQVLVQWLDLTFSGQNAWQRVSPAYRFGMRQAEEFNYPLALNLPKFPAPAQVDIYFEKFVSRIYPLFPVIDIHSFHESLQKLATKFNSVGPTDQDGPLLSCCYAVMSLGADECGVKHREAAKQYLIAAHSLFAHLVAMPYLLSVQALLLLCIALKCNNREGSCWLALGQAIRIAHSLGLHRSSNATAVASNPSATPFDPGLDGDLDGRIWWSLYGLEKSSALQTGRPSAIIDSDCDRVIPSTTTKSSTEFFVYYIGLAKIQSEICISIFSSSQQPKSARALFLEIIRLDRKLLDWSDTIPEHIRPTCDFFCAPQLLRFAGFLSLQFHETVALILSTQFLQRQVDIHVEGQPGQHRIRASEEICVNSARLIVECINELVDRLYTLPRLITATYPLTATFVLCIHLLKHPSGWRARPDLALLENISEFTEKLYNDMGQDPKFTRILSILRGLIVAHNKSVVSRANSSRTSPEREQFSNNRESHHEMPNVEQSRVSDLTIQADFEEILPISEAHDLSTDLMQFHPDVDFDELTARLFDSSYDIAMLSEDWTAKGEETRLVFGVPQLDEFEMNEIF